MHKLVRFFILLSHLAHTIYGDQANLVYKINESGSYSFAAATNLDFNLTNGNTFLQSDKMMYSTSDGSLKLGSAVKISGNDVLGSYQGMLFNYNAGNDAHMQDHIMIYNGGQFVRFTQNYGNNGVKYSNISNTDRVLSSFPSFMTNKGTDKLGFLHLNGDMCGAGYSLANFSMGANMLHSGKSAGPLVIFDDMDNVMIVSAFNNFMSHGVVYDSSKNQLDFGIMGGYTNIPRHFEMDTILYYGSEGINRAIQGWGDVISRRYGKTRMHREQDMTINYLGYYTDNGAYYYYNTEVNKTYEQTILDVLSSAKSYEVPFRYVQYDSWWYYKGLKDGVKEWVAMPSIFPNGSEGLFQEHGLRVAAHNRYWSSDNVYAKENGGMYSFDIDNSSMKAVPTDKMFWSDLFHNSTAWGLKMYEQDWLDVEFDDVSEFRTDINLAKTWLMNMGQAAEEHGMTIQYCMALPRHMLQSIEIPAVTQARVSGDYHPGNDQWKIGITSMFAHGLHIAPFKDTFWSQSSQPDSPYGKNAVEPNIELQAAIALLSTGPVGPGDRVAYTTSAISSKLSRNDGLLLKPSRPITMIDQHIINKALPKNMQAGSANLDAEVYFTYTNIFYSAYPQRHGIILATDIVVDDFKVYPSMMHLDTDGTVKNYLAYHGHPGDDAILNKINATTPMTMPKCGKSDFQLWYVAPVIEMSTGTRVAVLGERGKWVPVSEQRINHIEHKEDNLLIDIKGVANEFVQFGLALNETVVFVDCTIPTTGTSRISVNSKKCFDA